MAQQVYGFPAPLPLDVDFYTLSNEDIGFTADLVAGTNDSIQFALPYPSSIELWEESIVVHAMEFIQHSGNFSEATTTPQGLLAHLSMLDRTFSASWYGALSDTDDEAFKSKFAGPIYFGKNSFNVVAVASVEGTERKNDCVNNALYFPPVPLDLITPLYVTLTDQSSAITLATNQEGEQDYTIWETVAIRVWFTRRTLSASEKAFLNRMPTRFQQLDS